MGSYGNIDKVDTVGASSKTAKEGEKLSYDGVPASKKMASDDLDAMNKYQTIIDRVGKRKGIDPAVIAGIISRESRAGKALKWGKGKEEDEEEFGWGDWDATRGTKGLFNGFGLMQVDVNPKGGNHTKIGAWDSEEHLEQATDILIGWIKHIQKKFPGWNKEQQLKGGLAAYNQGDVVHSYSGVDDNTTGKDYSNDVVARAQWYKQQWQKAKEDKSGNGGKIALAAVAGAAICGVGAVFAAPFVLAGIGFGSAGIAAGSWAAGMMSSAAIANGGGVAAGSLVAILQSAGAAGLSATAAAVVGGTGAAVGGAVAATGAALVGGANDDDDDDDDE